MTKNNNPLTKLILKDDLSEEVLASLLENFIKIDLSSGKIILLPDFSRLANKEQVLIMILSAKALKASGVINKEGIGPKEIEQQTQLVGSTVRGILRDFANEKIVICEKGKYRVPNFLLYILKERLGGLNLEPHAEDRTKKATAKSRKSIKDFSRIKSILEADHKIFDQALSFLTDVKGKYLEKSLLILKIARDKFSIDGLTPAEIAEILRNKIRVPSIHSANVSLYLGKNSKYTFRDPHKGGYIYKLTKPGEEFAKNTMSRPAKEKHE